MNNGVAPTTLRQRKISTTSGTSPETLCTSISSSCHEGTVRNTVIDDVDMDSGIDSGTDNCKDTWKDIDDESADETHDDNPDSYHDSLLKSIQYNYSDNDNDDKSSANSGDGQRDAHGDSKSHSDSDSDSDSSWSKSERSEGEDTFDFDHSEPVHKPIVRPNNRFFNRSVSFEDQTYTPPGLSGAASSMNSTGKMGFQLAAHKSFSGGDAHLNTPALTQAPPSPQRTMVSRPRPTLRSPKSFDDVQNTSCSSLDSTPDAKARNSPDLAQPVSESANNKKKPSPRKRSLNSLMSSPEEDKNTSRQVVGKQMSMNSANRTSVGVKMKIKLDFIDDVNQEIHAEVFLSMHYKCAKARDFVSGQVGFVALSPDDHPDMLVPLVEFLNFRSCDHIEGFRLLVNTKSGVVYIYRVYRIVFRGLLKLDRFPFDRQIINIELKSFTCRLVPWSMPEEDIPYGIRADVLWRNHDIVVECDGSLWDLKWTKGLVHTDTNPSVYIASFGIGRISLFYMINFFLVSFFVVGSCFGVLAINHADFGTRSSITFTILLTVISTKFIMSSYTPKINYLTWLDYYNLLGMLFVIIIILENYMVSRGASISFYCVYPFSWRLCTVESEVIDVYVPFYMLSVWVLFHAFIYLGWLRGWFYESWEAVQSKDKQDVSRICGDVSPASMTT